MRLAALQFDVRRGDVDGNLERAEAGLRAAAEARVDLVVLPEMWPTSFVELDRDWVGPSRDAIDRVGELSGELDLVVCGSGFEPLAGAAADARPANVLHGFAAGERVLSYAKAHLFSPTGEPEGFSAGDRLPETVPLSGGALLSGVVCYDLRFGPLLEACYAARAEVLVVPAQWPSPRAAHWRALVLGRAAEGQCFVVAANRTGRDHVGRRRLELEFPGNSLVAGPDGAVRAEGRGEDGLVLADVDLAEARDLRRRVPVRRDRREDLYGSPRGESGGTPRGSL